MDGFSSAYLVVIVVRGYIWPFKGMTAPGEIWLIHFTPDFVSTFPIQVFAFTCAQNVRFPSFDWLIDSLFMTSSYSPFITRSKTIHKVV